MYQLLRSRPQYPIRMAENGANEKFSDKRSVINIDGHISSLPLTNYTVFAYSNSIFHIIFVDLASNRRHSYSISTDHSFIRKKKILPQMFSVPNVTAIRLENERFLRFNCTYNDAQSIAAVAIDIWSAQK